MKKSRILTEMNESARGLNRIAVLDQQTMREFDVLTVPPVRALSARQIRAIRARTRMSQAVFGLVTARAAKPTNCAKEDRMFSHAEEKFHFALHALTGAAPQRQRLENAFAHLRYLKAEELPELLRPKLTEIHEELEYVSGIAWHVSASAAIAKMSDEQVSQLARRVHDLHDALMNLSRPYPTSASDIK